MSATPHDCSGKVNKGWNSHSCSNKGKLEHEGKWYCGAHHPPTIEAKRKKSNDALIARIRAENEAYGHRRAALEEQKRRADLYPYLLDALTGLLAVVNVRIDDPRAQQFDIARAAIAKATGEPQ